MDSQQFTLKNPGVLYKPYAVKDSGINIKIFFRDRYLSDLIGFHYQETPHEKAAADLLDRIKRSGMKISGDHNIVVPIILDGENAWEFYPNNGRDFLKEFFKLIIEDKDIETVTFSEVLDMGIEPGVIPHLSSGSWVNGNFDIWIGDVEDRKAWELLEKTKRAIDKEEHQTGLSEDQKKKSGNIYPLPRAAIGSGGLEKRTSHRTCIYLITFSGRTCKKYMISWEKILLKRYRLPLPII